jgi:hypothetical protein
MCVEVAKYVPLLVNTGHAYGPMANHAPHRMSRVPAVAKLSRPFPTVTPRDSAITNKPSRTPTAPGTSASMECPRFQYHELAPSALNPKSGPT